MSRRASLVIALLLASCPPLAIAGEVPPDARWSEVYIRSADGTRLHMDVFRPRAGGRTPVILIPGPYFGTGEGVDLTPPKRLSYYDDLFAGAFRRGYSIIQLSVRGYGKSGGCPDWSGPREREDVVAGIRWAARQAWSTEKVGTYGLSYDGMLQFAALSRHLPEHAAAVPIGATPSRYRNFYMRRVRYQPFSLLLAPYTLPFTVPPPEPQAAESALIAAFERGLKPGCVLDPLNWANPDPAAPYWRARDYESAVARTKVPILWSQGTLDWSVHPDGLNAVWPRLRGPKRLWLAQHPHLVPSEWERGDPEVVGRRGWTAEVFRWFDRYLKGIKQGTGDVPVVVQEGSRGRWRGEREWPPADAQSIRLPVLPGSYLDAPGNKAEPYCTRVEFPCLPGQTGNGSWTFTAPLPHDSHLSGAPRVRLDVSTPMPDTNVIGLLYDVDPQRRASFITRGAALARRSGELEVDLYPQDWVLRRGHRLGLLLAGADDWWFEPGRSGSTVAVRGGSLRVPFLCTRRSRFLSGGPSQAVRERVTFAVPAETLATRTAESDPPPPLSEPGDQASAQGRVAACARTGAVPGQSGREGPPRSGGANAGSTPARLERLEGSRGAAHSADGAGDPAAGPADEGLPFTGLWLPALATAGALALAGGLALRRAERRRPR